MFKASPLSLLLVLLSCVQARAQDLPDNPVCEHLKKISVTVQVPGGSGSGAVIVRGEQAWVLTAGHVVDVLRRVDEVDGKKVVAWDDCKVVQKTVQDGRVVGEQTYDAEVIRYSDAERGEDLALLKVRQKGAFRESVSFYTGKKIPPVGTRLYHAGSPLGEIGSGAVIPGFYSQHGRILFNKTFDYITCSAFPGSSGGTMALEDGRWIGMVVRGANGGFILIVPVRRMAAWAERTGIGFILDPKTPVPSDADLDKKGVEESPVPMGKAN